MPKRGAFSKRMRRSRLALVAGDQRMQRRAEVGGAGRHVVDLAVGDHDGAADARRRHVAEGAVQRAEQPRLGALVGGVGLAGLDDAHVELLEARQPLLQAGERLRRSRPGASPMSWLWLRSTTSATTLFSGSRSSSSSTGLSRAAASAASAAKRKQRAALAQAQAGERRAAATGTSTAASSGQDRSGSKASDQFMLLPQPFEQHRHVHLVGLVVAGQHVHHDVDAGAQA